MRYLIFDLLRRQLPHRVLRERKMTCVDTRLVRVITGDAKGGEHSVELQEHRILMGAEDIREHSLREMINRMPEPSSSSFGPDEIPHFIEFGCATW